MMAGVFGYIGYNMQDWEDKLLASVNEKRIDRGMVPITRQSVVEFPTHLIGKQDQVQYRKYI